MQRRSPLLCGLILACCFIPISPFGGSIDLTSLIPLVDGVTLSSNTGVKFGTSIASCDINGDSKKDLIIGAPDDGLGKVTVLFGGIDFVNVDVTDPAASNSGFLITFSGSPGFGTKVACLGFVDGDLIEDFAIGSSTQDSFQIIYGSVGFNADFDASSLSFPAASVLTTSGSVMLDIVGLGDTTGDGKADFIVSLRVGAVYSGLMVYGVLGASLSVDSATPTMSFMISNGAGQTEPMSFASVEKFDDDDTLYDFAVGNLNDGSQAVVIFGKSGGGYSDMDFSATTYSLVTAQKVLWINADATYGLGMSMTYAGDINSDGRGDLLIGAPKYNSNSGAAFVVLGSSSWTTDVTITGIPGSGKGYKIIHGTSSGLFLGSTVFGGLTSGTNNFAVCDATTTCYVVFGKSTLTTLDLDNMKSEDGFPLMSSSVSVTNPMQIVAMGDGNNDSLPDLLIGQAEAAGGDGDAYILYGPNKCSSPCKTCTGLAFVDWKLCVTCETTFGYIFTLDNMCYISCPAGYTPDYSNFCIPDSGDSEGSF